MAKKLILNCPACGEKREMKAISKLEHSHGVGCLLDIGFLIFLVLGFFNPFLWILAALFFILAASFGFNKQKFWKCKNCGSLLPRD